MLDRPNIFHQCTQLIAQYVMVAWIDHYPTFVAEMQDDLSWPNSADARGPKW
jgi:hypothetical protein